jgi:hypothetical protein
MELEKIVTKIFGPNRDEVRNGENYTARYFLIYTLHLEGLPLLLLYLNKMR